MANPKTDRIQALRATPAHQNEACVAILLASLKTPSPARIKGDPAEASYWGQVR
jgi:hypothetical protein